MEKEVINEKYSYTKDAPKLKDMHSDVLERRGQLPPISQRPIELLRNGIKEVLGHVSTGDQADLDAMIDMRSLRRLFGKYGLNVNEDLDNVERYLKEKDTINLEQSWDALRKKVPYWFFGLIGPKQRPMEEEDKSKIANVMDIMQKLIKRSKKSGKEATKDMPKPSTDTGAKKNLDKSRKKAGIEDLSNSSLPKEGGIPKPKK